MCRKRGVEQGNVEVKQALLIQNPQVEQDLPIPVAATEL